LAQIELEQGIEYTAEQKAAYLELGGSPQLDMNYTVYGTKYKTPANATPKNVIDTAMQIVRDLDWVGKPIGAGCPAVVRAGITKSATNIDKSWIDYNVAEKFSKVAGAPVNLINDADAAGLAELAFGEAKGVPGVCLLISLGTGIGSAMFINGILVPNTELGMLKMKKGIAEDYATNRVREKEDMSWEEWGGYLCKKGWISK